MFGVNISPPTQWWGCFISPVFSGTQRKWTDARGHRGVSTFCPTEGCGNCEGFWWRFWQIRRGEWLEKSLWCHHMSLIRKWRSALGIDPSAINAVRSKNLKQWRQAGRRLWIDTYMLASLLMFPRLLYSLQSWRRSKVWKYENSSKISRVTLSKYPHVYTGFWIRYFLLRDGCSNDMKWHLEGNTITDR